MDVLDNLVFLSLIFNFQEDLDLELVQQIEKQSVYNWCFINSYICMQPNVSTLKFTSKVWQLPKICLLKYPVLPVYMQISSLAMQVNCIYQIYLKIKLFPGGNVKTLASNYKYSTWCVMIRA